MPEESASTADLFEIIRTTRSMRRLKLDPVPNELIRKILEAGVCAPSGGNMQLCADGLLLVAAPPGLGAPGSWWCKHR